MCLVEIDITLVGSVGWRRENRCLLRSATRQRWTAAPEIRTRRACRAALDDKEQRIVAALARVAAGKCSLRATAINWGIARVTLQDRAKRAPDDVAVVGRPIALPVKMESELASYAGILAQQGFALDRQQLSQLAKEVVAKLKVRKGDWAGGRDWFNGFMRRHPDLSLRTATASNLGRLTALDRVHVAHWCAVVMPLVERHHPSEISTRTTRASSQIGMCRSCCSREGRSASAPGGLKKRKRATEVDSA